VEAPHRHRIFQFHEGEKPLARLPSAYPAKSKWESIFSQSAECLRPFEHSNTHCNDFRPHNANPDHLKIVGAHLGLSFAPQTDFRNNQKRRVRRKIQDFLTPSDVISFKPVPEALFRKTVCAFYQIDHLSHHRHASRICYREESAFSIIRRPEANPSTLTPRRSLYYFSHLSA
jgi:hypothetical protein